MFYSLLPSPTMVLRSNLAFQANTNQKWMRAKMSVVLHLVVCLVVLAERFSQEDLALLLCCNDRRK